MFHTIYEFVSQRYPGPLCVTVTQSMALRGSRQPGTGGPGDPPGRVRAAVSGPGLKLNQACTTIWE
eukprot:136130-Hanusia_phi.AAC.1